MFRLFAPLTLIFIAVLTLALLLIHAQPYEDRELREWLLPKDCPAPCFIGIKPGVTTADEAMQILKASPWVEQVGYQFGSTLIRIKWKTNAPSWLAENNYGGSGSFISTTNGLVTDVRVTSNLTLGDIQLMFGQTPLQYVSVDYFDVYAVFSYLTIYLNNGVIASITKKCDQGDHHISHQDNVYLDYVAIKQESDLPRQYRNSWSDVLRASCS